MIIAAIYLAKMLKTSSSSQNLAQQSIFFVTDNDCSLICALNNNITMEKRIPLHIFTFDNVPEKYLAQFLAEATHGTLKQ